MDGIRFLRVSCPSILTALKIEGDRFSIHSTAMPEDSFSVMLIITLICLFTRYGVVKIQSLSSHNNAASFTKGLNNLGTDEGSTFCDLVIRYHLVKKLSSDENVRNEKKVPNQLESTKIRRKCPKSDESVRKQTRASEIGRKLSKTDGKVRNRKEAYTCKTVWIISNESFRNRIFCCVKSERLCLTYSYESFVDAVIIFCPTFFMDSREVFWSILPRRNYFCLHKFLNFEMFKL